MKHKILDQHNVIGWDFDDTLFNGPNSSFFREYIKAHPEKTHYIVTFRDRSWASRIPFELASVNTNINLFENVINTPQSLHLAFNLYSKKMLDQERAVKFFKEWSSWKALQCHNNDITLLVDDKPDWVLPGCKKYNIKFLNALDPISR